MSKHTPEPWKVQHPHAGQRGWEIADSSGLNQVSQDVTEANARRIVACVNACRGLPTDELEQKGLVAAVGTQLLDVERQRDELLAALEEARRAIGEHLAPNDCYATGPMTGDEFRDLVQCPACSAIAEYERVIAKVKGGAA